VGQDEARAPSTSGRFLPPLFIHLFSSTSLPPPLFLHLSIPLLPVRTARFLPPRLNRSHSIPPTPPHLCPLPNHFTYARAKPAKNPNLTLPTSVDYEPSSISTFRFLLIPILRVLRPQDPFSSGISSAPTR
jgi:hypothetical protein